MSRSLIGYVIVAGLATAPVQAQEIAQLGRRVDSVYHAAVVAREAVETYRRLHPMRFDYADSAIIARGRIRIYFDTAFSEIGHAGAAEAEKQLTDLGRAIDRLPPLVFTIVRDSAFSFYDERFGRTRGINVRQHLASSPSKPNRTSTESDPASIALVIVTAVSRAANGSSVSKWASGVMVAPALVPKNDWPALRLSIVSSPSPLGRSCYLGAIPACRLFLALDSTPDPIHVLFDSVGRQKIVAYEGDRSVRASSTGTERCLSGNDDACVAVLRIMGISPLTAPFVRQSVVTHALVVGGARAAERMVLSNDSPGEALAAAANEPLDSLIADWQRHLGERSGASGNLPITIAISSLLWIAVCVFLSLRSSRWR
jgi:hypothetical protein